MIAVQADANAAIGNAAGLGIGIDQGLDARHQRREQFLPARDDERTQRLGRLGRQLVGEDGLLQMERRLRAHVGDRRGEMVADVGAEELEHARPVVVRHEGIAHEANGVGLGVHFSEAEAAKLLEQRARMHVLRDRLRERLEARCLALARQRARPPTRVVVALEAEPAGEDLRRRRAPHRRGGRKLVRDPRDLAPREPGRGADAADVALGCSRIAAARGVDEGLLEALLDGGEAHPARQAQRRQRRKQAAERLVERGVLRRGGRMWAGGHDVRSACPAQKRAGTGTKYICANDTC